MRWSWLAAALMVGAGAAGDRPARAQPVAPGARSFPSGSVVIRGQQRAAVFRVMQGGTPVHRTTDGDFVVHADHARGIDLPAGATSLTTGTSLTVATSFEHRPPRLARLPREAGTELTGAGLDEAAAYPSCLTGAFYPLTAVYCPVTVADVRAGYLVQGEFEVVWVDGACAPPDAELTEFLTAVPGVRAGGHVVCTADDVDAVRRRFGGGDANGMIVQLPRSADGVALVDELMKLPGDTVSQADAQAGLELSRSAPVVASVGGHWLHVQGTFELRDDDPRVDAFPKRPGHLYAFRIERVPSSDVAFARLGAPQFDAADGIPTPALDGCTTWFGAGCRTVFGNALPGARPEVVYLRSEVAATLGLSARVLERVLESRLGGVDRSTPAVIESSPLAGESRPVVIYVGALDGMLHAICAESQGACRAPGQELWAFLPRAQLTSLPRNTQRIDGSPKVADVFGDFDDDGGREWRTVLAFQTGGGEPAIYALDITDPFAPQLVWDVPAIGMGLGVALGPVRNGTRPQNLVFAQTTAPGGFAVQAIDTVTGETKWTFTQRYPDPRDPSAAPVPASAIPGGVSALDLDNIGALTHLVAPTPYGDVWLLSADTGDSVYGEQPLFRFTGDHHPIGAPATIYVDRETNQVRALIVTGGYADPIETAWSPADADQYLFALPLKMPGDRVPLDETSELPFIAELGRGQRVFAQPTVAGNELFVVTDRSDVNLDTYGAGDSTGELLRYSLDDGARIDLPVTLAGGASAVDVTRDGVVHTGSAAAARKLDYSATFDADGITTELVFKAKTGRQVWLKLR